MKKNIVLILGVIFLAALAESINPVVGKIALLSFPPMVYNCLRFLFASLVISPFLLMRRKHLPKPSLSVLALCSIFTLNTVCFAYGVRLTTATFTSLLLTTAPLLTSAFLYWLKREAISSIALIGILLGGLGTAIIILFPVIGQTSITSGWVAGSILIGASVVTLVAYSILSQPLQERYSPFYLTAILCYLTTLVTALLALPDFIHPYWWNTITPAAWISVIIAGLTITLFSLFYQYAIQYSSPLIASLSGYLIPLLTFGIAWFFLGEYLTPELLLGALFILTGVYLVSTSTARKEKKTVE